MQWLAHDARNLVAVSFKDLSVSTRLSDPRDLKVGVLFSIECNGEENLKDLVRVGPSDCRACWTVHAVDTHFWQAKGGQNNKQTTS